VLAELPAGTPPNAATTTVRYGRVQVLRLRRASTAPTARQPAPKITGPLELLPVLGRLVPPAGIVVTACWVSGTPAVVVVTTVLPWFVTGVSVVLVTASVVVGAAVVDGGVVVVVGSEIVVEAPTSKLVDVVEPGVVVVVGPPAVVVVAPVVVVVVGAAVVVGATVVVGAAVVVGAGTVVVTTGKVVGVVVLALVVELGEVVVVGPAVVVVPPQLWIRSTETERSCWTPSGQLECTFRVTVPVPAGRFEIAEVGEPL